METVNYLAKALCESLRSFVSGWSGEKFGRINVETNVLPLLSTQKRQGGGAGGGEGKEEETVGILQGTFDIAQSFAGLGCMLGNQQQDIAGISCVRG